MFFWYRFFTYLFYPLAPIYLYFRKIRKKEDSISYKEKLSKIEIPRGEGFLIWFHAASVGESMSILPLIESYVKEKKIDKILLTSITLSSGKILKKRFSQNAKVIHQFLPLDISFWNKKFLEHWRPNLSVFIDSEIWPNLISQINKKKIPLLLLNARITKKSFLKWKFVINFAKKIFEKFDLCIASGTESENYLKILGAKNIKKIGNLKFSQSKLELKNKSNPRIKKFLINKKIMFSAISTHAGEELLCGKVHSNLKKKYKNIISIIIPRHVHRAHEIKEELNSNGLKVHLHSSNRPMNKDTDIYLVDTFGETKAFLRLSKIAFMGKSIHAFGGQNPLEAARLGNRIIHGPNIENFVEVYDFLKKHGISSKINSYNDLKNLVVKFERKKNYSQQIIKKLTYTGNQILINNEKEINKYF